MVRTIQQAEDFIADALCRMRSIPTSDPALLQTLDFLAPRGFRPVVEIFEDNLKKRKTAPADKWTPVKGEIRICFEPCEDATPALNAETPCGLPVETHPSASPDARIAETLSALDEAETSEGRTFVALKWFRDEFLPSKGFAWAQGYDDRQAVLAKAISDGFILTSKVANPRAPLYPTTTIKLNRQRQQRSSTQPSSRFRPVRAAGEPLSHTILRDRGSH